MISYLLMTFGISCDNKWIEYFLFCLTLSSFSMVMIALIFPFSLNDELKVLKLKIVCSLTAASNIISILIIKFNYKIVGVFDQIEDYQIKSFIKHEYYFSAIIQFYLLLRLHYRRQRLISAPIYISINYLKNLLKHKNY